MFWAVWLKRKNGKTVEVSFSVIDNYLTVTPLNPLASGKQHVLDIGRIKPQSWQARKMKARIKIRFTTAEDKSVGLLRNTDAFGALHVLFWDFRILPGWGNGQVEVTGWRDNLAAVTGTDLQALLTE